MRFAFEYMLLTLELKWFQKTEISLPFICWLVYESVLESKCMHISWPTLTALSTIYYVYPSTKSSRVWRGRLGQWPVIHTYIHGLLRQKAAKHTTKQKNTQLNIRKNIISKRTKSTRNWTIKTPYIKSLIHSLFAQKHQIPTELHLEKKIKN